MSINKITGFLVALRYAVYNKTSILKALEDEKNLANDSDQKGFFDKVPSYTREELERAAGYVAGLREGREWFFKVIESASEEAEAHKIAKGEDDK